MITWHYIARKDYDAAVEAGTATADKLFFLSDTREIYKGTQLFNESVELYSELPSTAISVGKLYIDQTTLEGKIWNGSAWVTVINPVAATLTAENTTVPVSGKAVADYVTNKLSEIGSSADLVKSVAYVAESNSLTVTTADSKSQNIPMTNVAADLEYDSVTGSLKVKTATGTVIGTGVNLALERFVSEARYDPDTHKIILSFNDSGTPLEIDVGDLVDTYTAANSQTVTLTLAKNQFTAAVNVSKELGNTIVTKEDGLYVAATDISGKADKVAPAAANNIATLAADGNLQDSGYVTGGAALADSAKETTLATEKAVATIRDALKGQISGKMSKVQPSDAGEIIVASSDGDAEASGVKIGGAAFAGSPDTATVATEKGTVAHVAGYAVAKANVVNSAAFAAQNAAGASDDKVTSEKAIVDALTWKTTV